MAKTMAHKKCRRSKILWTISPWTSHKHTGKDKKGQVGNNNNDSAMLESSKTLIGGGSSGLTLTLTP